MAYRDDQDLRFLQHAADKDLNDLVQVLIYDKDGKKRYSENLSEKATYKANTPKHSRYWQDIAEEIQRFGANGIITNIFRGGKGILYREVLCDVCEKMDVNFNKDAPVYLIEENLLMKILSTSLEKMSEADVNELARSLGLKNKDLISAEVLLASFQTIFLAGGFKSYQLTLVIVNAISNALFGRGLALAGNAMLTRTASILTGPIGWAITGIWTAIDLAGPAYRVTIPAAIQVAVLRKKQALTMDDLAKDLGEALG
nr:DUF3944 domain-containing protein [Alcaligenes faecalis]